MNNTRAIALTAVCSAMATVCFVGASYVELFGFILSLLGGMLLCVPMIVTPRYRPYSLLALVVSFALTGIFASARIVELVYYCFTIVPLVIIKAWCDGITLDLWQEDSQGNQTRKVVPKAKVAKWVLYYIFTQISIAAIIAVTYLLMPLEWQEIVDSYILYIVVLLLELVPLALDRVLNGTFPIVQKAMIKAKLTP